MQALPKQAYPLQWPVGYKRTPYRRTSQFKQSAEKAQQFLKTELNRLGATSSVISSNVPIRQDGMMYADAMRRLKQQENDPGVAVYFTYKGNCVVLCCDTYTRVWENVYAIAKTIENLRAVDRYGVSDFLTRSFTGFAELPSSIQTPFKKHWWEVLGVDENASELTIRDAYRALAFQHHPDRGGNHDQFIAIKEAYDQGINQFY